MKLDIILPCYNPLPDWADNILDCYARLRSLDPETEFRLVLVNDGSARNVLPAEVEKLRQNISHFEYLNYSQNRGKGYAIRQGAELCRAPYVIFTDIDFPYLEEDLLRMYAHLRSGDDLVFGTRQGNYYEKAPLYRALISKVLKFLIRLLLRTRFTDSQGGLKGFSQAGLSLLKATTIDRYLFDLELLKRASREKGLKMSSIPVSLKPHVVFAPVGLAIIRRELLNFWKILWV
jgi:dolichyl-phosphate beta-glucosyltransferase